MSRGIRNTVLLLVFMPFFSGVPHAQETMQVTVSILPQKYFVERIGGDRVSVMVMVPPGSPPNIYEPKPRQMVQLSHSKLYFAIGVPFENVWLGKISAANPRMTIVHTDDGIVKLPMTDHIHAGAEQAQEHDAGAQKDTHIWLSPPLVMVQARHILYALVDADPANRAAYLDNYKRFMQEVTSLDAELTALFAGAGSQVEFLVFHPAWGYFAQAYGLTQIAVETEGKEPKPAELIDLIDYARKKGIKVIFVQPQIFPESAAVIAREIGGKVLTADPLAPDWFGNLKKVANTFKTVAK